MAASEVPRLRQSATKAAACGSRAVAAAAGQFHRYPDGGATRLRAAIGARFGLDPARIVCGAGSDDLLYLLCHIYGGAGTELIIGTTSISPVCGRTSSANIASPSSSPRSTACRNRR